MAPPQTAGFLFAVRANALAAIQGPNTAVLVVLPNIQSQPPHDFIEHEIVYLIL